MKNFLIVIFLFLIPNITLAGTSELYTLAPYFQSGKMITIDSYNSGDYPDELISLKNKTYKDSPVRINALIIYPDKGEGPFPILVYNHASGGAMDLKL
tara:strand:- start:200 stop:493 length:294 start_codon:yes stop_codon:yes gene_type:complete